ncbi:hypothetical protein MNBD_GAMMA23-2552 [hydrothermal vent metagenome]|uniref:Transposase n=1 Tax=hydrothermal vent metagenome TaxID=652676 RepID=A0A3B1A2R7_9ZZZZ
MVEHPAEYRWSSYRVNGQDEKSNVITPHACYLGLHQDSEERKKCYRHFFEHQLDASDIHAIREAAQFSMPLGNDRFKQQIETALERSIGFMKRGRPTIQEDIAVYFY